MITLKNINISYHKNLIRNGAINILDSAVTVITGSSGSGKSSLLYLLGLISDNFNFEYHFNGKEIDLKSDKAVSRYRKKKIGYVFQENTLIDRLSVRENIQLAARIAETELTENHIQELLAFVQLDISLDAYPPNLSGGEKQRLAIACAIAKQPDLLIADEPTSALDPSNAALVVEVLKKYAHGQNKMVVIATHDPFICENADYIYGISDLSIQLKKSPTGSGTLNKTESNGANSELHAKPLGIKFFTDYYKKSNKKKAGKTAMLILCGFAVAFAALAYAAGSGFTVEQEKLLNQLSDKEILLVNQTAPSLTVLDYDENLSISSELYEKIKKVEHISNIYPFFEFRSLGASYENMEPLENSTITVDANTQSPKSCVFNANDPTYNAFSLQPYYSEQPYSKQLEHQYQVTDASKAVYISSSLAHLLGLSQESQKCNVEITIGVPVATLPIELQVNSNSLQSNSNTFQYPADVDVSQSTVLTFEIAGILNDGVKNSYSASGSNIIYVPINTMIEIQKKAQSSVDITQRNDLSEWAPSSYMIYADHYSNVKPVISRLQNLSAQFKGRSNYQDIESMNQLILNVKNMTALISTIILLIFSILMAIIFTNYIMNRKYETAILRANGLTMKEMIALLIVEAIYQVRTIMLWGLGVSAAFTIGINSLTNFRLIAFDIKTILLIIGISILTIIIPTFISAVMVNKNRPSKVLRN